MSEEKGDAKKLSKLSPIEIANKLLNSSYHKRYVMENRTKKDLNNWRDVEKLWYQLITYNSIEICNPDVIEVLKQKTTFQQKRKILKNLEAFENIAYTYGHGWRFERLYQEISPIYYFWRRNKKLILHFLIFMGLFCMAIKLPLWTSLYLSACSSLFSFDLEKQLRCSKRERATLYSLARDEFKLDMTWFKID